MEWMPILYAGIYLLIGWTLSDLLEKDDDAMALAVFMVWPAVVTVLFVYVVVRISYRLRDIFHDTFDGE